MLIRRIAYKYLSSKKSHSVVNLIARTAVVSIAIPVAAAVLVLSLQKGLSEYIGQMYNDFDAQLKISRIDSKPFGVGDSLMAAISSTEGVKGVSGVLEGEVLLEYGTSGRSVATIKGVDSSFADVVNIEERVTHGAYQTRLGDINQLIVGQGIAYYMGINPAMKREMTLYWLAPQGQGGVGIFNSLPDYNKMTAFPAAVFAIDESVDSRYVIADLEFARRLLRKAGLVSSVDLAVDDKADIGRVKADLAALMGVDYKILDRAQQHASLFRIMNIERWIIFALLIMITALASLSLCGTIIMMKTEKEVQNRALLQMGFTPKRLRRVFTGVGVMITGLGLVAGLVVGLGVVALQQQFGFLKMSGESMLLDAYPVSADFLNILYLAGATAMLGYLISYLTSKAFRYQ